MSPAPVPVWKGYEHSILESAIEAHIQSRPFNTNAARPATRPSNIPDLCILPCTLQDRHSGALVWLQVDCKGAERRYKLAPPRIAAATAACPSLSTAGYRQGPPFGAHALILATLLQTVTSPREAFTDIPGRASLVIINKLPAARKSKSQVEARIHDNSREQGSQAGSPCQRWAAGHLPPGL